MKEEDILLKKLGKEDSFKVPDGYFENLTSEVMNKLPEKEKVLFKEEPVSTWTSNRGRILSGCSIGGCCGGWGRATR